MLRSAWRRTASPAAKRMPITPSWHPSPAISRAAAPPRCSAAGRSSWRACWSTPPTSDWEWAPRSSRRASSTTGCTSSSSWPAGLGILARVALVREERLAWSMIGVGRTRVGGRRHLLVAGVLRRGGGAVPVHRRRPLPLVLPAGLRRASFCWCAPACAGSMRQPVARRARGRPRRGGRRGRRAHAADPRRERGQRGGRRRHQPRLPARRPRGSRPRDRARRASWAGGPAAPSGCSRPGASPSRSPTASTSSRSPPAATPRGGSSISSGPSAWSSWASRPGSPRRALACGRLEGWSVMVLPAAVAVRRDRPPRLRPLRAHGRLGGLAGVGGAGGLHGPRGG